MSSRPYATWVSGDSAGDSVHVPEVHVNGSANTTSVRATL